MSPVDLLVINYSIRHIYKECSDTSDATTNRPTRNIEILEPPFNSFKIKYWSCANHWNYFVFGELQLLHHLHLQWIRKMIIKYLLFLDLYQTEYNLVRKSSNISKNMACWERLFLLLEGYSVCSCSFSKQQTTWIYK